MRQCVQQRSAWGLSMLTGHHLQWLPAPEMPWGLSISCAQACGIAVSRMLFRNSRSLDALLPPHGLLLPGKLIRVPPDRISDDIDVRFPMSDCLQVAHCYCSCAQYT